MKKKELKIIGLSYSQTQIGSYVVVLSDRKGLRKLPLIIKPAEAQRIALELEDIKPQRPMTHDIFKTVSDSFGIDVQEVFIHSLLEGIFYTKMIVSNGLEEIEVECSLGDAIAFSALFKCPIYTTSDILKSAGIFMNDDGTEPKDIDIESYDAEEDDYDEDDEFNDLLMMVDNESPRKVSIEDLEKIMNEAIANEEYEIAAEMRDRIQKLKEK
jgi:bifunctional DNase/RNase